MWAKRFVASLVLIAFLGTNTGFSQTALPVRTAPAGRIEIPSQISVPSELGEIQETHFVNGKPLIVLIQDAHAIVDAQTHIQDLIQHLKTEYGIGLVALEGGAGPLDPTLLGTFPDEAVKKKVLAEYLERGELTGAEMGAALHPSDAKYVGIEDWGLYEDNYLAYLEAVRAKDAALQALELRKTVLDERRTFVYAPAHNEFHEKVEQFRDEKISLFDFLKSCHSEQPQGAASWSEESLYKDPSATTAALPLAAPQDDNRYPNLTALADSVATNQAIDHENLNASIRQMAEDLKNAREGDRVRGEVAFNEHYQAFLTGDLDASSFLKFLIETARTAGLKPRLTPAMQALLQQQETLSAIKGTKLFDELEHFIETIQDQWIATPEQKEIRKEYKNLRLLHDLASLELTHDEWNEINCHPEAQPKAAQQSSQTDLCTEILHSAKQPLGVVQDDNPALHFYRLALQRDTAFHKNLTALLQKEGSNSAIVITGGFHTQGLKQILKADGFSYAVVTPKINSLEGESAYQEVMSGKRSYQADVETDFYDAFHRHILPELVQELNRPEFKTGLKTWRDELIRKLSDEGRIDQAGKYTGYLDALVKIYHDKFGTGFTPKAREEILKDVERELKSFNEETLAQAWQRFQTQLADFTAGLESLAEKKELNIQNVASLLDRIGKTKSFVLGKHLGSLTPGLRFDLPELVQWMTTGELPKIMEDVAEVEVGGAKVRVGNLPVPGALPHNPVRDQDGETQENQDPHAKQHNWVHRLSSRISGGNAVNASAVPNNGRQNRWLERGWQSFQPYRALSQSRSYPSDYSLFSPGQMIHATINSIANITHPSNRIWVEVAGENTPAATRMTLVKSISVLATSSSLGLASNFIILGYPSKRHLLIDLLFSQQKIGNKLKHPSRSEARALPDEESNKLPSEALREAATLLDSLLSTHTYKLLVTEEGSSWALKVEEEIIRDSHALLNWRNQYIPNKTTKVVVKAEGKNGKTREFPVLYLDFSKFGLTFPGSFSKQNGTFIKPATSEETQAIMQWKEDFQRLSQAQDPIVIESISAQMDDLLQQAMNSTFRQTVEGLDISLEQIRYLVIIREIMAGVGYMLAPKYFDESHEKVTFAFWWSKQHDPLFTGRKLLQSLSLWVDGQELLKTGRSEARPAPKEFAVPEILDFRPRSEARNKEEWAIKPRHPRRIKLDLLKRFEGKKRQSDGMELVQSGGGDSLRGATFTFFVRPGTAGSFEDEYDFYHYHDAVDEENVWMIGITGGYHYEFHKDQTTITPPADSWKDEDPTESWFRYQGEAFVEFTVRSNGKPAVIVTDRFYQEAVHDPKVGSTVRQHEILVPYSEAIRLVQAGELYDLVLEEVPYVQVRNREGLLTVAIRGEQPFSADSIHDLRIALKRLKRHIMKIALMDESRLGIEDAGTPGKWHEITFSNTPDSIAQAIHAGLRSRSEARPAPKESAVPEILDFRPRSEVRANSADQARRAVRAYGLKEPVTVEPVSLPNGYTYADVFLVTAGDKKYVLKQPWYRVKREFSDWEASFIDRLRAAGIPAAGIVRNRAGRTLTGADFELFPDVDFEPFILYDHIEGERLNWGEVTGERLVSTARLLASIHEAGKKPVTDGQPYGYGNFPAFFSVIDPRRGLRELEERYQMVRGHDRPVSMPSGFFKAHYQELRSYFARFRSEDYLELAARLPRRIVHGDYHNGNMVFQGDQVAGIFDFEFAHEDARVDDFANALLISHRDGANRLDWEKIRQFLIAYQQAAKDPITAEELEILPDVFRLHAIGLFLFVLERASQSTATTPVLQAQLDDLKEIDSYDWAGLARDVLAARSEARALTLTRTLEFILPEESVRPDSSMNGETPPEIVVLSEPADTISTLLKDITGRGFGSAYGSEPKLLLLYLQDNLQSMEETGPEQISVSRPIGFVAVRQDGSIVDRIPLIDHNVSRQQPTFSNWRGAYDTVAQERNRLHNFDPRWPAVFPREAGHDFEFPPLLYDYNLIVSEQGGRDLLKLNYFPRVAVEGNRVEWYAVFDHAYHEEMRAREDRALFRFWLGDRMFTQQRRGQTDEILPLANRQRRLPDTLNALAQWFIEEYLRVSTLGPEELALNGHTATPRWLFWKIAARFDTDRVSVTLAQPEAATLEFQIDFGGPFANPSIFQIQNGGRTQIAAADDEGRLALAAARMSLVLAQHANEEGFISRDAADNFGWPEETRRWLMSDRSETRTKEDTGNDAPPESIEWASPKARSDKLRTVRDWLWDEQHAGKYRELQYLIAHRYRNVPGLRLVIQRLLRASSGNGAVYLDSKAAGELFIAEKLQEHLELFYDVNVLAFGLHVGFREIDIFLQIIPKSGVDPPRLALKPGLYLVEAKEDDAASLQSEINTAIARQVPHQIENAELLIDAGIPVQGIIVAAGGKNSSRDPERRPGILRFEKLPEAGRQVLAHTWQMRRYPNNRRPIPVYSMVVGSFDIDKDTTGLRVLVPDETQIQKWAGQQTGVNSLFRNILNPAFGVWPLLREKEAGERAAHALAKLQRLEGIRYRNVRERMAQKARVREEKLREADRRFREAEEWEETFEKAGIHDLELAAALKWYFAGERRPPLEVLRLDLQKHWLPSRRLSGWDRFRQWVYQGWRASLSYAGWQRYVYSGLSGFFIGEALVGAPVTISEGNPEAAWKWLKERYQSRKPQPSDSEQTPTQPKTPASSRPSRDRIESEIKGPNGWIRSFANRDDVSPDVTEAEAEGVLRTYFQPVLDGTSDMAGLRKGLQSMIGRQGRQAAWDWLKANAVQRSETRNETVTAPSETLTGKLIEAIRKNKGRITFAEFQRVSLFDQQDGYYTGGTVQFTESREERGDGITFWTNAHLPDVGRALARHYYLLWKEMGRPDTFDIVEIGGGDGSMAKNVLNGIKRQDEEEGFETPFYPHARYTIVDISPALSRRQRVTLETSGHHNTRFFEGAAWNLPFKQEEIKGVIFSNELPDAFPVHRVINRNGELKEVYVTFEDENFQEEEGPLSTSEITEYFDLVGALPPEGKEIAVNLHLKGWLEEASRVLGKGFVITVDYGFHPTRVRYDSEHQEAVWNFDDKPVLEPGVDLTHNIDFETLNKFGMEAGFHLEHIGELHPYLNLRFPGFRIQPTVLRLANQEEWVSVLSKRMAASRAEARVGTNVPTHANASGTGRSEARASAGFQWVEYSQAEFGHHTQWIIRGLRPQFNAERKRIWENQELGLDRKIAAYTNLVDGLVTHIYQEAVRQFPKEAKRLALVAVGSYGRREMLGNVSDADGRIVASGTKTNRNAIRFLSQAFNDVFGDLLGQTTWPVFEVGEPINVVSREEEKLMLATEMLDARFVAGNRSTAKDWERKFMRRRERFSKAFVHALFSYWNESYQRAGAIESLYEREPNLKAGVAGLRAMHFTRWIAQAYFKMKGNPLPLLVANDLLTAPERAAAEEAYHFLSVMRNTVGAVQLSRGSANFLTFNLQGKVAERMNYQADPQTGKSAVEQMLQDYYTRAQTLFRFSYKVIRRIAAQVDPPVTVGEVIAERTDLGVQLVERRGWSFNVNTGFVKSTGLTLIPAGIQNATDPERYLLPIFIYAAEQGVFLSGELMDVIERAVPPFRERMQAADFRRQAQEEFARLLQNHHDISYALWRLHLLGMLAEILPGFGGMLGEVRADFTHRYTLDVHALKQVELLEGLLFQVPGPAEADEWDQETRARSARAVRRVRTKGLVRVLRVALLTQTLYESRSEDVPKALEALALSGQEAAEAQELHRQMDRMIELMRRHAFLDSGSLNHFIHKEFKGDFNLWAALLVATLVQLRLIQPERYWLYVDALAPALGIGGRSFNEPKRLAASIDSEREKRIALLHDRFQVVRSGDHGARISVEPLDKAGAAEIVIANWGQDVPGQLAAVAAVVTANHLEILAEEADHLEEPAGILNRFVVRDTLFGSRSWQELEGELQDDLNLFQNSGARFPDWMDQIHQVFARHGARYSFVRQKMVFEKEMKTEITFEPAGGALTQLGLVAHWLFYAVLSALYRFTRWNWAGRLFKKDRFTWVRIRTPDRTGLLHVITRVFAEHGINILPFSTIDTEGYDSRVGRQAVDTFPVTKDGLPLSPRMIHTLREDFERILNLETIDESSFALLSSRAEARRVSGETRTSKRLGTGRSEARGSYEEDKRYYARLMRFPEPFVREIFAARLIAQQRRHPELFEEHSPETIIGDINHYISTMKWRHRNVNELWKELGGWVASERSMRKHGEYGFLKDSAYQFLASIDQQLTTQEKNERSGERFGKRNRGVSLSLRQTEAVVSILVEAFANQALGFRPEIDSPRRSEARIPIEGDRALALQQFIEDRAQDVQFLSSGMIYGAASFEAAKAAFLELERAGITLDGKHMLDFGAGPNLQNGLIGLNFSGLGQVTAVELDHDLSQDALIAQHEALETGHVTKDNFHLLASASAFTLDWKDFDLILFFYTEPIIPQDAEEFRNTIEDKMLFEAKPGAVLALIMTGPQHALLDQLFPDLKTAGDSPVPLTPGRDGLYLQIYQADRQTAEELIDLAVTRYDDGIDVIFEPQFPGDTIDFGYFRTVELDIADEHQVRRAIERYDPDVLLYHMTQYLGETQSMLSEGAAKETIAGRLRHVLRASALIHGTVYPSGRDLKAVLLRADKALTRALETVLSRAEARRVSGETRTSKRLGRRNSIVSAQEGNSKFDISNFAGRSPALDTPPSKDGAALESKGFKRSEARVEKKSPMHGFSDAELRQLFHDSLVVMNKPAGETSIPDPAAPGAQPIPYAGDRLQQSHPGSNFKSIGRLDRNTTGLLLFEDYPLPAGQEAVFHLTDILLNPTRSRTAGKVVKTYQAVVRGTFDQTTADRLVRQGVPITVQRDKKKFGEALKQFQSVSMLSSGDSESKVEVALDEGKYRQVRKMLHTAGHRVRRLERTAFGEIRLGNLGPGEIRRLTDQEIQWLISVYKSDPEIEQYVQRSEARLASVKLSTPQSLGRGVPRAEVREVNAGVSGRGLSWQTTLFRKQKVTGTFSGDRQMVQERSEARGSNEETDEYNRLVSYVAHQYKWGQIAGSRFLPAGGGVQSRKPLVIETSDGPYVIKRLNVADADEANFITQYTRHLGASGIPVAIIDPDDGPPLPVEFEGKYYTVEKLVEAREVFRERATTAELKAAGRLLGEIHRLSKNYTGLMGDRNTQYSQMRMINLVLDSHALWREAFDQYLSDEDKRFINSMIEREVPIVKTLLEQITMQVIPSDLNFGNLLFDPASHQIATIFDWDQARIGYRVEDFYAILIHRGRQGQPFYRDHLSKDLGVLLEGYRETAEPLTDAECAVLSMIIPVQHLLRLVYFLNNLGSMDEEQRRRFLSDLNEEVVFLRALKREFDRSEARTVNAGVSGQGLSWQTTRFQEPQSKLFRKPSKSQFRDSSITPMSYPKRQGNEYDKEDTTSRKQRQAKPFWAEEISENHSRQHKIRSIDQDLLRQIDLPFVHEGTVPDLDPAVKKINHIIFDEKLNQESQPDLWPEVTAEEMIEKIKKVPGAVSEDSIANGTRYLTEQAEKKRSELRIMLDEITSDAVQKVISFIDTKSDSHLRGGKAGDSHFLDHKKFEPKLGHLLIERLEARVTSVIHHGLFGDMAFAEIPVAGPVISDAARAWLEKADDRQTGHAVVYGAGLLAHLSDAAREQAMSYFKQLAEAGITVVIAYGTGMLEENLALEIQRLSPKIKLIRYTDTAPLTESRLNVNYPVVILPEDVSIQLTAKSRLRSQGVRINPYIIGRELGPRALVPVVEMVLSAERLRSELRYDAGASLPLIPEALLTNLLGLIEQMARREATQEALQQAA